MFTLWRKVLNWIETGDLILPVVAVSAAHYAVVLAGKDLWFIAFVIGVLVDLGHYRIIKAAIRYGGWFYVAALVMTALAFGFHLAFYGGGDWRDLMAAAAMPICIMFLAGLSVKERWATRTKDKSGSVPPVQSGTNGVPTAKRGTYEQFKMAQMARNGDGPMSVDEVVAQFGVPKRTAYNWMAKYKHN